jgi:pimeloyl-ACP methyl ester carboxylesterase
MSSPRRTLPIAAGVAVAAGAGIAALRAERRWRAAVDANEPAHYDLPAGRELSVRTDDGAELAVTIAGEGPMVVLAHCWTGARQVWAPVAHRLIDRGRTVVLYDQRGHGSSTVGSDGFTIERLGGDLRAVLEAVDADDAVVGGHSMGGMTVQSLAVHHPDVVRDRVRSIVLVATASHGLGGPTDARALQVIASPLLERAMRSRVGHAMVRGAVGRDVRLAHLVLTRDLFVACAAESRAGFLRSMQGMDLREALAKLEVPTTVVLAERDRVTPIKLGRAMAAAIPEAELIVLDHVGHMLPFEAPDELTDVLAS